MATSTSAQGKVYCFHSNIKYVCLLFQANVVRWRWRRFKGTPSYQDEEWITLEGWVHVHVCVCYVTMSHGYVAELSIQV